MSGDPIQIQNNFERVLTEIEQVRKKSRYSSKHVNLVVVTKGQTVDVMRAAYSAGVRMFGENYPEETEQKIAALGELQEANWHMIGHLQSRKARIVASYFNMMHSLDSLDIARRLNERLSLINRNLPVLIEVNVGGETSKFGFEASNPAEWARLLEDFAKIADLSCLAVRGLMTMPPLYELAEKSRPNFSKMRNLQSFLRKNLPNVCWDELSMGTSYDYQVAVEEGATYVRIGTAIVGERQKPLRSERK